MPLSTPSLHPSPTTAGGETPTTADRLVRVGGGRRPDVVRGRDERWRWRWRWRREDRCALVREPRRRRTRRPWRRRTSRKEQLRSSVGMSISMDSEEVTRSKEASEFGDQEVVARSKEFSQKTDLSRDSGENGVKAELSAPGPSTPMQVASLPREPREASVSCPSSATTGSTHSFEVAKASVSCPSSATTGCTHSFEAAKASCELQLASGTPQSLPASTQGEMENDQVLSVPNECRTQRLETSCPLSTAVEDDFGRPSASVYPRTMGVSKKAVLKDEAEEVQTSSKSSEEEASMPTMDHPSFSVKSESGGFTLDAGLSLGSQFLGSKERRCVEFSRVWESVGAGGGRGGEEGVAALQGKGGHAEGKHLQLSLGPEMDEKAKGVEHRFRQLLDSSDDPLTKRVKREVVEPRMSLDGSREQTLERNEVRDRKRSCTSENKQEDFRSLFWGNGGTAFGRVLEVSSGEPKTMVVKKTPKRVHNSDPSAMFSRSELLMLEDSMRSPGSVPRMMFSPYNKPGMNGSIFTSDLASFANPHSSRKPSNLVCGRERGLDYSKNLHSNSSAHQTELESRLDRGSTCSLMSASKSALLNGEPSLSLNFSPKPLRPSISVTKTSTEEEWGKSLALCGPGAELPSAVERSGEEAKTLSYQERFVQLQLFLKKCDEDDQSYLLDALRSLSAAGRSTHAVGLEHRALLLSFEEEKEMKRLKSLNVMGQRSSIQEQSEAGCAPQGPRVASFGAGAEYAQQQSLANTRSPQVQMVRSGSMGGSAFKESYRSG